MVTSLEDGRWKAQLEDLYIETCQLLGCKVSVILLSDTFCMQQQRFFWILTSLQGHMDYGIVVCEGTSKVNRLCADRFIWVALLVFLMLYDAAKTILREGGDEFISPPIS
eukprot:Gb_27240 [translate_table: standard]